MSALPRSLLDLKSLSLPAIEQIFSSSRDAKRGVLKRTKTTQPQTAALLFFEPSTRTLQSFETACHRADLRTCIFVSGPGTSMEKGETIEDTVRNIAAMGHEILVIRTGDNADLSQLETFTGKPIINAGWGRRGHPTQALLDVFTISEFRPLDKARVLFIGDINHSRVASSHFELLEKLSIEYAICGPPELLPKDLPKSCKHRFDRLEDGLDWANVIMALRYQMERHETSLSDRLQSYHQNFGLTGERVARLPKDTIFMHPGPVTKGMELTQEVYDDKRSVILQQVSHGVWLRQAILTLMLEGRS